MLSEVTNIISSLWVVFSFSFLVALTGAMAPGPLLTYTIIKSVQSGERGYLMGLWIITGHAILEMGIIIFLLLGFSFVLQNIIVVRTIGIAGGALLIYFGLSIIRDIRRGNIPTYFLNSCNSSDNDLQDRGHSSPKINKNLDNPIVGGIVVSMSNPYWWVWWATIGFAFMIQFEISFRQWPRLLAFFIGHEAGDLAWYLFVSILSFFGLRYFNKKVYCGILVCCGIFMILFGIYMGFSPFLRTL
ncbi:MAG: LysE family transporter [Thermodesulfobacteriota bacterium]|nr:LysE family transporter [Thermodesulfobacteriota bacterium]